MKPTTTGVFPATINNALAHLEMLGIVRELTTHRRNRLFSYTSHVEIMIHWKQLTDW